MKFTAGLVLVVAFVFTNPSCSGTSQTDGGQVDDDANDGGADLAIEPDSGVDDGFADSSDFDPADQVGDFSDAGSDDAGNQDDGGDQPGDIIRPVILIHGVNGSAANFDTMVQRLINDGWPEEHIYAYTFEDPSWGCNVDNAATIAEWVQDILTASGQPRVDMVAHSMGTLSSRYYIKNLGGTEFVNVYVTIGGMNHGLTSPCWSPIKPCIWEELCSSGEFIAQLNADPATPGELYWVSIYSTTDSTVAPESAQLEGAENIEFEGIDHDGENGLLEVEEVYLEVRRVLRYPNW
ncbi:MAG: hypothetical protein JRJ19_13850 [Deltaproteobacteria bacterium]|nr:hypothetical protein [Deltaproteobacteria bacterium]